MQEYRNVIALPLLLFSRSIESDSLQPHGRQHARLPYPSLSPRTCSDSCPLSWWCHPIISSTVVPLSSHLQSFPAPGSFPMSWLFTSRGQSIGTCFSISSSNEYLGLISFRIDWLDLLAVQGTLKSLLQHFYSNKRRYKFTNALILLISKSRAKFTQGYSIYFFEMDHL